MIETKETWKVLPLLLLWKSCAQQNKPSWSQKKTNTARNIRLTIFYLIFCIYCTKSVVNTRQHKCSMFASKESFPSNLFRKICGSKRNKDHDQANIHWNMHLSQILVGWWTLIGGRLDSNEIELDLAGSLRTCNTYGFAMIQPFTICFHCCLIFITLSCFWT